MMWRLGGPHPAARIQGDTRVKILSLAAILCLACGSAASAQTAAPSQDEAVLAVVDRFFTALAANDFATLSALRLPGSANIVERPSDAGGTTLTRREFTAEGLKKGRYLERYWDPIVHVRGGIAVVWAPYEFWLDGKTSHCGIDVFEMARQEGTWRIADIMWTVEPDACPALRPSDPARMRPPS
jgi:hypothetical protein